MGTPALEPGDASFLGISRDGTFMKSLSPSRTNTVQPRRNGVCAAAALLAVWMSANFSIPAFAADEEIKITTPSSGAIESPNLTAVLPSSSYSFSAVVSGAGPAATDEQQKCVDLANIAGDNISSILGDAISPLKVATTLTESRSDETIGKGWRLALGTFGKASGVEFDIPPDGSSTPEITEIVARIQDVKYKTGKLNDTARQYLQKKFEDEFLTSLEKQVVSFSQTGISRFETSSQPSICFALLSSSFVLDVSIHGKTFDRLSKKYILDESCALKKLTAINNLISKKEFEFAQLDGKEQFNFIMGLLAINAGTEGFFAPDKTGVMCSAGGQSDIFPGSPTMKQWIKIVDEWWNFAFSASALQLSGAQISKLASNSFVKESKPTGLNYSYAIAAGFVEQ
ncbi:hypothetical protein EHI42_19730 [Rhizobium hidalgonense]|uniref:hypothetical protein n=1 Tax=Rhizobium hidalgonense TaxID=1538159 RepID=UPI000FEC6A91|nr:hypothetical protein [Rhizobium hidalgonense]RWX13627.1 hypothetical protein EHI42_19730 [Rhizobium hidalgonense]